MNKFLQIFLLSALCLTSTQISAQERLIIVDEGNWQTDNGRLSYFENGEIVSNQWFRDVNGYKIGDTPNDIIQVNDNLLAIAINWSNIIQFISPDGKAVAATEDVPNNRRLASDGNYVYVTSYGHECGIDGELMEFTKGYVAKIDISTFKVVAATEVGYEPDGIAIYNGYLFVSNSGDYAFQEDHEYETTVSVIDSESMEVFRTIDTAQINKYGKMSQSGKYLCMSSPGDLYEIEAATIIMDCEAVINNKPDKDCFVKFNRSATYNCVTSDGKFYAIGSRYSYLTGEYTSDYLVIDPAKVMESNAAEGLSTDFPGTLLDDIKRMGMPYCLYVNPYTGYIYATDAGSFASSGALYQWTPEGEFVGKHKVYINPGSMIALKPDNYNDNIESITDIDNVSGLIFDLNGYRTDRPVVGKVYIRNGKKFIQY